MPINPNIALGGQPVQQPNILGQMGQMMAIRAAQQEIEGSEGVKNYFAKPESERDPTALLGSKQGRESLRALNESKKQQTDLLLKNLGITASAFGVIEKNPTVETAQSVFSDLVRMEVMPEKVAQASIAKVLANPTPENIRSLARQGIDYGISAADKLTAQTRLQAANIGAGPGHRQANLAEQKFEFEKANPGFTLQTLDNGNIAAVNKRTNEVTLLQTPGAAPAPTTPPVNALSPAAPAANLNSLLNPPVVNQPGAPTRANAAALAPTPLRGAARPGYEYNAQGQQVPISDPTKVVSTVTNAQGDVSGLNYKGEVVTTTKGIGKPSPGFEKRQGEVEKLSPAISQANDALKLIDRMVGTPDGKIKPASGFKGAVGAGMGLRFIPGTSEADFQAMNDQITGGAFLQAFNDLKGGGAITEKEGEKATNAITRMKLSLSEKEYITAAREFQEVLRRGVENAQRKIKSGGAVSPASTGDIASDPAIQTLLDKYK